MLYIYIILFWFEEKSIFLSCFEYEKKKNSNVFCIPRILKHIKRHFVLLTVNCER